MAINKKYTKKQIQEAIAYWKKRLNESYGPNSFNYGDGSTPITGKEFCELLKKTMKQDINRVFFRYAHPDNGGNATQNLVVKMGKVYSWAEGLKIGQTTGQTIGNEQPFNIFMKALKDGCGGKKLSDLAKNAKAVGLQYQGGKNELAFVIVGVNIGMFSGSAQKTICFYVDPAGSKDATDKNDGLGDDWI